MSTRKLTIKIIAVLFIILWVPAGFSKLIGYEMFRFQLGRSPYVQDIAGFIYILLPTSEIFIAVLLVFKRTRMLGMYASFFLMFLFTGYVYAMLNYSYFTPCSCGGILALFGLEDNWQDHLKFNIVFTMLGLTGILLSPNKENAQALNASIG